MHAYERTLPIVNGSLANGTGTGASPYHNPQGTVHVVIGMAGDGFCCGGWSDTPPRWSAFREDSFGYTRVHVESDTELRLDYIRNGYSGGTVDGSGKSDGVRDSFTITKSQASVGPWRAAVAGGHRRAMRGDSDGDGLLLPEPRSHLGHRAHLSLGACPEHETPRRP